MAATRAGILRKQIVQVLTASDLPFSVDNLLDALPEPAHYAEVYAALRILEQRGIVDRHRGPAIHFWYLRDTP